MTNIIGLLRYDHLFYAVFLNTIMVLLLEESIFIIEI